MKTLKIMKNSKLLHIYLSSGDPSEDPGCVLCIAFWRWYITLRLPPLIKPEAKKVFPKWDQATVVRLRRNYYWQYTERRYGISLCENHLNIDFGRHTNDSSTEQRWGCFLPWAEWRFIRHSVYGLSGEHLQTWWETSSRDVRRAQWEHQREYKGAELPKAVFTFVDFDGEVIQATTFIDEREWRRGEGWFKWLSLFYRAKIIRSLDIEFSKDTGAGKGSWKGGTIGHSIEMRPGELHEAAFRRYCDGHKMTFIWTPA